MNIWEEVKRHIESYIKDSKLILDYFDYSEVFILEKFRKLDNSYIYKTSKGEFILLKLDRDFRKSIKNEFKKHLKKEGRLHGRSF